MHGGNKRPARVMHRPRKLLGAFAQMSKGSSYGRVAETSLSYRGRCDSDLAFPGCFSSFLTCLSGARTWAAFANICTWKGLYNHVFPQGTALDTMCNWYDMV